MAENLDLKGQINRDQARKAFAAAAISGLIAGLLVIQADLPVIVDTMTPLGVALAIGLEMAIKALRSGTSTVKDSTNANRFDN